MIGGVDPCRNGWITQGIHIVPSAVCWVIIGDPAMRQWTSIWVDGHAFEPELNQVGGESSEAKSNSSRDRVREVRQGLGIWPPETSEQNLSAQKIHRPSL
jgi:hypothetical protein